MDGRRRRWIAFDAMFFDNNVAVMILDRFGPAGITIFVAFLCAAKRSIVEGQIEYGSEADLLAQLGLPGLAQVNQEGVAWTFPVFWRSLASHKQVATKRRGRLTQVRVTKWAAWQQSLGKHPPGEGKPRSGAKNAPPLPEDTSGMSEEYEADIGLDRDLDLDLDLDTKSSSSEADFDEEDEVVRKAATLVAEHRLARTPAHVIDAESWMATTTANALPELRYHQQHHPESTAEELSMFLIRPPTRSGLEKPGDSRVGAQSQRLSRECATCDGTGMVFEGDVANRCQSCNPGSLRLAK